ncbi:MAG: GntR family transcriptional regulator [bacterium]
MASITDIKNSIPKYCQLSNILENKISNGELKKGKAIPSNPKLMRKYAVSQNTVRQAINLLVQKGLLYTDQGRGTFVSELSQTAMNNKNSGLIGVIVPSVDRPFIYSGTAFAIESEAHRKGYNILLGNANNNFVKIKKYITSFARKNVDGIILVPHMTSGDSEYETKNMTLIRLMRKSSIPFVFFDGYLDEIETDCVLTDNEEAGFILTEHLIKQGYKRIAFIRSSYMSSARDRIKGYKKALQRYALEFNEKLIIGKRNFKDIASAVNALLNSSLNVDSIVCVHDGLAVKVLDAVKERGLSVPSDIGIAGFDDNAASLNVSMPLTSIRQPVDETGKQAANLIIDKINKKIKKAKRIVLKPELVVRSSSLRPKDITL